MSVTAPAVVKWLPDPHLRCRRGTTSPPLSLHPSFVVLPFATLFALSVAVTASTFKKYL